MSPAEVVRRAAERLATERLAAGGCGRVALSRLYRTPAWPAGSGPDFVNAAASVPAAGSADRFMRALHRIEAEFGRRRERRWAARTLDLDLIAWGDLVAPDAATQSRWRRLPHERQQTDAPEQLILPHPRLQERAFVLVPLAAVAPDWRHPVIGKTVVEMLGDLPGAEKAAIEPM